MAKKNVEATETTAIEKNVEATETTTPGKKRRVSIKDKARMHIYRITKKGVVPMVLEEVLTAYAALGILKYDEVLEMSDTYSATFITEKIDN